MKKEKKSTIEKIGNVINLFGTAILMNLLFLAACLPIVTIGQAWCGLLSAIRYNIRGEGWFEGFKKGYKTRFWRGTIFWCIGLLVCMVSMNDLSQLIKGGNIQVQPFSWALLAFVATVLHSAMLLNVYIYTDVNNWLKNTVNLMFRGLIPMVIFAALFWLPVVMVFLINAYIVYEALLILVCAYYSVLALVETMVMKNLLTRTLLECRSEGLIVAEEGATPIPKEDGEEE